MSLDCERTWCHLARVSALSPVGKSGVETITTARPSDPDGELGSACAIVAAPTARPASKAPRECSPPHCCNNNNSSAAITTTLGWGCAARCSTRAPSGLLISARSLQIGPAVSVIAVTSVAANALTIAAGPIVFSEPFPAALTPPSVEAEAQLP